MGGPYACTRGRARGAPVWPDGQWRPGARGRRPRLMREALITGTLWTIYVSTRGTALAIETLQRAVWTSPTRWASAAASVRDRTSSLERMRETWTLAVFSAM